MNLFEPWRLTLAKVDVLGGCGGWLEGSLVVQHAIDLVDRHEKQVHF